MSRNRYKTDTKSRHCERARRPRSRAFRCCAPTAMSVGPRAPAVGGEILAIAALANVRLALVRVADHGVDPVLAGILQRSLLGVEPQLDLRLRIGRAGP